MKQPKPTEQDKMVSGLSRVLAGRPIDEVAPVLVVAVARTLVIDAGGDEQKLGELVGKFNWHLMQTISDMIKDQDNGRRH